MKTTRKGDDAVMQAGIRLERRRRPPFGLQELAQDDVALQRRQVIDEQHAVKMVDLMLHAGGEQTLGGQFPRDVVLVEIAVRGGGAGRTTSA